LLYISSSAPNARQRNPIIRLTLVKTLKKVTIDNSTSYGLKFYFKFPSKSFKTSTSTANALIDTEHAKGVASSLASADDLSLRKERYNMGRRKRKKENKIAAE